MVAAVKCKSLQCYTLNQISQLQFVLIHSSRNFTLHSLKIGPLVTELDENEHHSPYAHEMNHALKPMLSQKELYAGSVLFLTFFSKYVKIKLQKF